VGQMPTIIAKGSLARHVPSLFSPSCLFRYETVKQAPLHILCVKELYMCAH